MTYAADDRGRFDRRCRDIYRHQRERAAKNYAQLPYGLAELRALVMHRLTPPDGTTGGGCHYCGAPLGVFTFTIDHQRPVSRGGAWELSNLVLACAPCNESKGDLTGPEFGQLRELIVQWPPRASESLLRRLRQSWRTFRK